MTGRRDTKPPQWWQLPWKEIGSFVVGTSILLWQTALEDEAQLILVGAALALMGVTGAGTVQRALRRRLEGSE